MQLQTLKMAARCLAGMTFALLLTIGSNPAQAQEYGPPRRESPVDRTIHDLEELAHRTAAFDSGRERGRYDSAIRRLSDFQNAYFRGRFKSDKLEDAIESVKGVAQHNPLDDRARHMLWDDLNDLRAFRATRGYQRQY